MSRFQDSPYSHRGVLNWQQIRALAQHLIAEFDVKCSRPDIPADWLSGGNLQKLILARELTRRPRLLVAAQPSRGLDVGAIEFVHRKLLEERDRGAAVLLISSELDEILALSDQIVVMYEGDVVGAFDGAAVDLHEIGMLMAGAIGHGSHEVPI